MLTARINPNLSPTTYHFEYGTDGSYGSRTVESAPIAAGAGDASAAAQLSGLAPGTTYHFHVVATNGIGTTSGSDQTFTTGPPPAAAAPSPSVKKCKAGFVRRHARCVRKKRHPKRHQKRHHRHLRGHGNG